MGLFTELRILLNRRPKHISREMLIFKIHLQKHHQLKLNVSQNQTKSPNLGKGMAGRRWINTN